MLLYINIVNTCNSYSNTYISFSGSEISGGPGARDHQISRRTPKNLNLGARRAPTNSAFVCLYMHVGSQIFIPDPKIYLTGSPKDHRLKKLVSDPAEVFWVVCGTDSDNISDTTWFDV